MHSDYLNEQVMKIYRDKICEMFHEDQECAIKREEVSLNFTVTSRQSKTCVPIIGNINPHSNVKYETSNNKNNSQHIKLYKGLNSSLSISQITYAQKQLKRFNRWVQDFNKYNQKILDQLSTINTQLSDNQPQILHTFDFIYLKKICNKFIKVNSIHHQHKNNGNICEKYCHNCKKKDQIIQIIREQYDAKLQQCKKYQELQLVHQQSNLQHVKLELRDSILNKVQINILIQQKQLLNQQITNLKLQLQKYKMEKSTLMQKSNSFLKTKQLLQKKIDYAYNNSKLFSNAKYSTNAIGPNDSINRQQSIVCFGEPNIDQLIRFYGQQQQSMKIRCRELITQQQRTLNKKFTKEQRVSYIRQKTQYKLMECYKIIKLTLTQIKYFKQKQSYIIPLNIKQKKIQEQQHTITSLNQNEQYKKIIIDLQKKIKCIENQKNNLNQTNSDLINILEEQSSKFKQLEQLSKKKDQTLKKFQNNQIRAKNQYLSLYEKYKTTSVQRKRLILQIEEIKGMNRVYCRVRPRIGAQLKTKTTISYSEDNRIIKDGKQYDFNYVFSDKSTQREIFNQIKGLVQCAFDNKNLCIFAYGQAGSGKTYTLHGTEQEPGLGIHIIECLFEEISKVGQAYDIGLIVNIVEIYKQQIWGLSGVSGKIEIKQDSLRGTYLEDCKSIRVHSKQQLLDIYYKNIINRNCNQNQICIDSNRSHCIFTITIQHYKKIIKQKQKEKQLIKCFKICLVDLAAAQKLTTSNPLTTKQVQATNKGFLNLLSVFSALKSKSQLIPYKDSKLTHFLKQFLTRQVMLPLTQSMIVTYINISSSDINSSQTTNSLIFGMKARGIQRQIYSRSKDAKQNKQCQKNRRSSTRLSIS